MIKNGLFGYGRFLLTLVFVSVILLMSGCCSFCDTEKCCPKLDCDKCEFSCDDCPKPEQERTVDSDCKYCDMDIVYAFNTPASQGDCPENTTYIADAKIAGLDTLDGGAGIVDRSGGAGIVDRKNQPITSFCRVDCKRDEEGKEVEQHVGIARMNLSYESDFVVADDICQ